MKKALLCTILCIVLLISGCGKQATLTDESIKNEEVTENETEIAVENEPVTKSEEENSEEIIVVDESEMKYQELLAKYENTPYKNPNKLEYIPRVGETFNFSFCDTIKSVEDIGGYQDYPNGYFVIHFSTDANDVLVSDSNRLSENIRPVGESSEFSDLLLELEISLHQKGYAYNSSGEWGIDFEEGCEIEYHKASMITNVIDTGVVYEGMKYFEIDNGYGLKNLVEVYESSIPNEEYPLYELGYFEDGIYYNSTYNIKVSADRLNIHESFATTDIGTLGQACFNETLHIGERGSAHFLEFYTYEFKNANLAQSHNVLETRPDYTLLDTEETIAGKSYHRAEFEEILANKSTTSVLLWRCEENRVYIISSRHMISKNELLDLLSPLSGE